MSDIIYFKYLIAKYANAIIQKRNESFYLINDDRIAQNSQVFHSYNCGCLQTNRVKRIFYEASCQNYFFVSNLYFNTHLLLDPSATDDIKWSVTSGYFS